MLQIQHLLDYTFEKLLICLDILVFFIHDTATTEIYTLSLHDALPIPGTERVAQARFLDGKQPRWKYKVSAREALRSEEHTSELQSRQYLVCRLLLEKKKRA